jgi:MoxR-like ATPase
MDYRTAILQPGAFKAPEDKAYEGLGSSLGDRRDGSVYVFDASNRVDAAVRVALATKRPLLLRGPAGSGKSSLAPFIARILKRRFYWTTVTARTEARDLMWEFDALRRLGDAQLGTAVARQRVERLANYVQPRVLWWAFDPDTARRRGARSDEKLDVEEAADTGVGPRKGGVVVLIDEIDKADPDVPNNLLECLGSLQFTVLETGAYVRARSAPLVVITTNDERELPDAFRRRCAILYLPKHERADLVRIASQHFGARTDELYGRVADELAKHQAEARKAGHREPSTAEYLDAVSACVQMDGHPDTAGVWPHIAQLTLVKQNPFDEKKTT